MPASLRPPALLAALALASCSRAPAPPSSPEAAARLLVRMAAAAKGPGTDWSVVAERGRIEADPVLFATTAAALGGIGESCDVVRVEESASESRRAVDLVCALVGGGKASLALTTEELPDRTWRVVSIEGPGIGWPAPRPTAGDGLTTSAPP